MAGERHFYELARQKNLQEGKHLCIGLDPNIKEIGPLLPKLGLHLPAQPSDGDIFLAFNQRVIEVTADIVGAYKPQSAFYEILGSEGFTTLQKTRQAMRSMAPDVPELLDAKRGDTVDTSEKYAQTIFDELGFDAVTVSPYLGGEPLQPFLSRPEKGVIVLDRTSNPGADELQAKRLLLSERELTDLLNGPARTLGTRLKPEYAIQPHSDFPREWTIEEQYFMAHRVVNHWDINKNCALVVGATYPDEARTIRGIAGAGVFFLLPGVGKGQGQKIENIVPVALRAGDMGVVNISRGSLYIEPNEGEDYFDGLRRVALDHDQQMRAAQQLPAA